MTHRGPLQPLPCWNSVILMPLTEGSCLHYCDPHFHLQTEGLPSLLAPDLTSVGILLLPRVPASFRRAADGSSRRSSSSVPAALSLCSKRSPSQPMGLFKKPRGEGNGCRTSSVRCLFFWGKCTVSFSSLPAQQQSCNSQVLLVPLEFRRRWIFRHS